MASLSALHRLPFEPGRDLAKVERFCLANSCTPFPSETLRRLLTTLVSDPAGVVVLARGVEPVFVLSALDALESAFNYAIVDVLGLAPEEDAAALFAEALGPVEDFVSRSPRSGVEIPVQPRYRTAIPSLVSRGYTHAFSDYLMRTPTDHLGPEQELPGPAWRWSAPREELLSELYAVGLAAFAGVPGAYQSALDEYSAAILASPEDTVVLMDGDRVAGYMGIGMQQGSDLGEVRRLARAPSYRGRGLGPLLLSESLRRLRGRGARAFELDVTATNQTALTLYQRFGFEVVEDIPIFQRAL